MLHKRKISSIIIEELKKSHEIIVLFGTRQTGKTSLTKLISNEFGKSKNKIFYFDFEDKTYRNLFDIKESGIETIKNILKIEGVDIKKKNLIIFDEIQLLDDPSNLLKLLHDHFSKQKIIATGSSSLQIKHKFTDSLAGRKKTFKVEPLNFDEFLLFKGEDKLLNIRNIIREEGYNNNLKHIIDASKDTFINLFEEYITYGGYPEVVLSNSKTDKINKLKSISNAYIQKDIREFANIDNIDAYNNLIKYIAINSGNLINISSVSNTLGMAKETVNKYINLLKETFIIDKLMPFYTNKTKEISKNYKLYFKDNGVRNLQLLNFNLPENRTDKGILYENHVFNTLENNKDALMKNYFYRTQLKTEIDIISKTEDKIKLIEVKSSDYKKNVRAFTAFEGKYSKTLNITGKIIINKSYFDINEDISYIPAYLLY
ncbi:MAG: ATP-binding protein [Bacteroidales bacterium]|nr:ATP-binding protein [Bacteroidales bacterium]